MTLVEDARKIAISEPLQFNDDSRAINCLMCNSDHFRDGHREIDPDREIDHAPDCSWLAMPKIVAALEAADRLVLLSPEDETLMVGVWDCHWCGGVLVNESGYRVVEVEVAGHAPDCDWQALVAALKGEA